MDPFALLGVPARFGLDARELEQRHRELSRALHPDRHASAPAGERRMLLSKAIEVNEAFRALKDPVKRAEKLLEALGVPSEEGRGPKASPELLMEMMDAREELADAARAKDLAKVESLGRAMRTREQDLIGRLTLAFELAGADKTKLDDAHALLGELRYARRYLDEVAAFEEALTSP